MSTQSSRFILLMHCPDQKGIIASVTNFIHQRNGNIVYIDQYVDRSQETFYMRIVIEGKIKTRKWEDKDGNTRYNTEILADNMNMLGGKQSQGDSPLSTSKSVTTDDKSDDLPF